MTEELLGTCREEIQLEETSTTKSTFWRKGITGQLTITELLSSNAPLTQITLLMIFKVLVAT